VPTSDFAPLARNGYFRPRDHLAGQASLLGRIGGMIGHGPPDQDQLGRHAIAAHGEGVAAAVVGAIDQRAAHTLGTTPQF
jgi:hypothetical protein